MESRACSTLNGHPEVNHAHTLPASGKHKACKPPPSWLMCDYYSTI